MFGLCADLPQVKCAGAHLLQEDAHGGRYWSLDSWTLDHPQYWCRSVDGKMEMHHASFAYPEVIAHRRAIVREVLEKYRSGDGYHIGDLDLFEQEVVEAHEPVDETFLFLCKDCHRAYDAVADVPTSSVPSDAGDGGAPKAPIAQDRPERMNEPGRVRQGDVLPITLIPSDQREFKQAFIASEIAEIREYYQDGRCNSKPWRKRGYGGFTEKSNVIGNLRSRPEYRSGVWQESGIVRIEVEVKR